MNKTVTILILFFALVGCEDATNAMHQAQDAASKAVNHVQKTVESVDLSQLNFDQLGEAAQSAKDFAGSVEKLAKTDLSDPTAFVDATEQIANAYRCLIDSSSEATAESLMDKVLSSVKDKDVMSLIEKGVEKAKTAKECVS
ncbi:hypothetical protein [Photobacterium galatheae]|uniref:Lipoprotein n=1 Tax=Photobacterium galatheae TaxID=1654360 RepID=A0A066RVE6_9GAMM|nr:hypothetical protein [Photobacterium galatheae]KDM91652.1 hypothetical protein EA58_11580 [Photobacterium galatheae]MCM0149726.1 hypothetical protein [Photobacterium galatheae]